MVSWKRIGFVVLLFMARLLSIEREYFDAAAVDGANWGQTFRHVALPQMRSIIQFASILGFIEVFSFTFAYVFVLTRGGPFNQTYNLEFPPLAHDVQSEVGRPGFSAGGDPLGDGACRCGV